MNAPSSPRGGRWSSPLARYGVGLSVLAILFCGLAVQLAFDSAALGRDASNEEAHEGEELQSLTKATLPLRGVDKRVADTGSQIQAFYTQRIPSNYSSIATRLGEIEAQSGVELSHVGYSQRPRGNELTELSIDTGVGGEYPQIMKFVNGLERDQMFFVIRAMSFQGQQGGQVNLQLRVSTWLRPSDTTTNSLLAANKKDVAIQTVNRRQ